jgi:hypothetical protein
VTSAASAPTTASGLQGVHSLVGHVPLEADPLLFTCGTWRVRQRFEIEPSLGIAEQCVSLDLDARGLVCGAALYEPGEADLVQSAAHWPGYQRFPAAAERLRPRKTGEVTNPINQPRAIRRSSGGVLTSMRVYVGIER